MKNILVPTDFSAKAYVASTFAARLAQQTGARLILFHAYSGLAPSGETEKAEVQIQKKLDELAHELHSVFGISVTRLIKPGFVEDELEVLAQRVKADLIVLAPGQTSGGKLNEKVLSGSAFPAIVIPDRSSFTIPTQVQQQTLPEGLLANTSGRQAISEIKVE